jgi:hypothetical protein
MDVEIRRVGGVTVKRRFTGRNQARAPDVYSEKP